MTDEARGPETVSPKWEACKVCGGDHWTRDHWAHTTDEARGPDPVICSMGLEGCDGTSPHHRTPDEARGPSGYWYRSTSIPEEREPATNAGKALDGAWPGSHIERLEWRRKIVAIEAEARAEAVRSVREGMRALPRHHDDYVYDEDVLALIDEVLNRA